MERGAGDATGVLRDFTLARFFSRDFGAAFGARFAFKRMDLGRAVCRLADFFTALVFDLGLVAMVRGSSAKTAELIKVVALKVKLASRFHMAE